MRVLLRVLIPLGLTLALVALAACAPASTSSTTTSSSAPMTSTTSAPPTSTTAPPTTTTTQTTTSVITSPTTTTAPPTTTTTSTPPTSTAATYQSLSALGQSVYASSCAACHGTSGQGGIGPALWGPGTNLGTYLGTTLFANNAQAMLDYISAQMPLSSPGSLPAAQYTQLLCLILVQNNLVTPTATFSQSQLANIALK